MTRTGTAVGLLVLLAIVGILLAVDSAGSAALLAAPHFATLAAGFTLSAALCICTAAVLYARGDRRE